MILVFVVNIIVVAIAVIIHYEVLFRLSSLLPSLKIRYRLRILIGVFGALFAHAIEVWLFAMAYYFMHDSAWWGELTGNFNGSLLDYTTLGMGDIVPMGHLRFLTGIESLTGLVLITWSASFLYIEMRRYWDIK